MSEAGKRSRAKKDRLKDTPAPIVPGKIIPAAAQQGEYRAGMAAILGRPNVGKSTLLNRLLGQKLSITSRKPQTTRNRIAGIITRDDMQVVLADTPGFQIHHGGALNRGMNRVVRQSLDGVDAVLFVVEALRFGADDARALALAPPEQTTLLVVNKIDKLADKSRLLPFLDEMSRQRAFAEIVPLSAAKGSGIEELLRALKPHLPQQAPLYAEDELTDASERFLASELIREKLFRQLGDELPYASTVAIEKFDVEKEGALRRIYASIIVDKESQKGMVVGAGGARLKEIGTRARIDMEQLFGSKVYLEIWVKVRSGWSDDERFLGQIDHG